MSNFKLYIRRNSNSVVLKGDIYKFSNFANLSDQIFEGTQKSSFVDKNENLKQEEKYKLSFSRGR